ncbi:UDP-glucose 4-epimerase GalE, partial [Shigella sonnei]|nr:UDP-glucose 4-epimerase GalE [Shigella sonnei]
MTILITGGAGYIGSHTVLALLCNEYDVIVLDNECNSSIESLSRVKSITGKEFLYVNGDVRDRGKLRTIFKQHEITDIIHFAGLKSVGESIKAPLQYYNNNVMGAIVLLEEMISFNIPHIIFSSSATVYGEPTEIPVTERSKIGGTTNPYGTSKLMVEQILEDVTRTNPEFRATILRYFNPVGAHPSGHIGEDPNGTPNNLVPYVCQVAIGKYKQVSIYGNDYPTKDGTGVRDFIHVMDLADGHVAAVQHRNEGKNHKIYNLGTGVGHSVLDILKTFKRVASINIPYSFNNRRPG